MQDVDLPGGQVGEEQEPLPLLIQDQGGVFRGHRLADRPTNPGHRTGFLLYGWRPVAGRGAEVGFGITPPPVVEPLRQPAQPALEAFRGGFHRTDNGVALPHRPDILTGRPGGQLGPKPMIFALSIDPGDMDVALTEPVEELGGAAYPFPRAGSGLFGEPYPRTAEADFHSRRLADRRRHPVPNGSG